MESLESLYEKFLSAPLSPSERVSTDTRKITPGSLFFALKGERFNANTFAAEALEKGAAYVIIDEPAYQTDRCLLVDDVLTTLQDLARHHRQQLDIPMLGINGTNGKTTTKELTHVVLRQKYRTLATVGNLNNHIGVPLTLLRLTPETEMAIIELGANREGEISMLCQIARPTHGLTTNIGKAHMEGFGGLEGAIRGESEQFEYMQRTGGVMFVNSQNELLRNRGQRLTQPHYYPAADDYFSCKLIGADPFVAYRHENGQEITTQLVGDYNFENIAAALCIGKFFHVPAEAANEAVRTYRPDNKRSQIVEQASNTLILDAYNANPDSMQAALRNLEAMRATHKVAILGDMYELGEDAAKEHRAIGELLAQCHMQEVLLCGALMQEAYQAYPSAQYFADKAALEAYVQQHTIEQSTILIKGSRGMAMETLVEFL